MIQAFAEAKACGDHLVVRVGPGTGYRGKPWLKKCWGEIKGRRVVLEAYENDETVRPTTFPMVMAAVRAILAKGFEAVVFTRIEDGIETEFTFTQTEGKITLTRRPIMPFSVKIKADIDQDGEEFSDYAANYKNLSKEQMHALQSALINSLLDLGSSGPEVKSSPKK